MDFNFVLPPPGEVERGSPRPADSGKLSATPLRLAERFLRLGRGRRADSSSLPAALPSHTSPRESNSLSSSLPHSLRSLPVIFHTSGLVLEFIRLIVHTAFESSKTALATLELTLESVIANTDLFQSKVLYDLVCYYLQKIPSKLLANPTWLANIGRFSHLLVDKVDQDVFINGEAISFQFLTHVVQKITSEMNEAGAIVSSDSSAALASAAIVKAHLVTIHRALNRLVLRLSDRKLSGFMPKPAEQFVQTLNLIIDNQAYIFAPNNTEQDFVACLCHLLIKLALDDNRDIRVTSMNIWKLLLLTKPTLMEPLLVYRPVSSNTVNPLTQSSHAEASVIDLHTNGFEMLLSMDFNVFFNWLTDSLPTIHKVFEVTLTPVWSSYHQNLVSEKMEQSKRFRERQHHWQHRTEARERKLQQLKMKQYQWMHECLSTHHMKDGVFTQLLHCQQTEFFSYDSMSARWTDMVRELSHERAAWGTDRARHISKWRLGTAEGPFRMQKLLEPNPSFFLDYPPEGVITGPVAEPGAAPSERKMHPTSLDAFEFMQAEASLRDQSAFELESFRRGALSPVLPTFSVSELVDAQASPARLLPASVDVGGEVFESVDTSWSFDNSGDSSSESELDYPLPGHSQSQMDLHSTDLVDDFDRELFRSQSEPALQVAQAGCEAELAGSAPPAAPSTTTKEKEDPELNQQKINLMSRAGGVGEDRTFNAGLVIGMERYPGLFIISTQHCSFLPFFVINSLSEIVEDRPTPNPGDPFSALPPALQQTQHWSYAEIVSVQRRLYLLQRVAVELFLASSETVLLVFDTSAYQSVAKQLSLYVRGGGATAEELLLEGTGLGIVSLSEIEQGGRRLAKRGLSITQASAMSAMTQRWQEGSITNFHYLMYLNTCASRSYNDLAQYPVFPWVIADFESDVLDLNDPATYRDLSKPMGALCEPRGSAFRARYDSWEPIENDNVPKFHYGCHYSSAGAVLQYLFRVEPFTKQFLKLMSGQFDHPDRLFHSIAETFQNAAGVQTTGFNMADVKECIPAFYYFPEMFPNLNRFDFGARQSGEVISDTALPPWAYNDSMEFVKRMRQALESDYVSAQLHNWIDLIFGYKQRGEPAAKAQNVFYYLTYQGAIDIDSIRDPTERAAVIAQIDNFGQTPLQLFDRPHPPRSIVPSELRAAAPTLFTNEQNDTDCSAYLEMNVGRPVGTLLLANDAIQTFAPHRKPIPPYFTRYLAWGYADRSLRVFSVNDHENPLYVFEAAHGVHDISAVAFSEDGKYLVTGGRESVLVVYRIESDETVAQERSPCISFKLRRKLYGHFAPITSICISRPWNIIVSGSADHSCIVWHLHKLQFIRQLSASLPAPVSCIAINERSGEIVACAGVMMNVWTINGQLIVSKNTASLASTFDDVTCLAISHREDYEDQLKIYVTGHQSGHTRVWRVASFVTANAEHQRVPTPQAADSSTDEIDGVSPSAPSASSTTATLIRDLSLITQIHAHSAALSALYLKSDQTILYTADVKGTVVRHQRKQSDPEPQIMGDYEIGL